MYGFLCVLLFKNEYKGFFVCVLNTINESIWKGKLISHEVDWKASYEAGEVNTTYMIVYIGKDNAPQIIDYTVHQYLVVERQKQLAVL